jgi:hypothetical protein
MRNIKQQGNVTPKDHNSPDSLYIEVDEMLDKEFKRIIFKVQWDLRMQKNSYMKLGKPR